MYSNLRSLWQLYEVHHRAQLIATYTVISYSSPYTPIHWHGFYPYFFTPTSLPTPPPYTGMDLLGAETLQACRGNAAGLFIKIKVK